MLPYYLLLRPAGHFRFITHPGNGPGQGGAPRRFDPAKASQIPAKFERGPSLDVIDSLERLPSVLESIAILMAPILRLIPGNDAFRELSSRYSGLHAPAVRPVGPRSMPEGRCNPGHKVWAPPNDPSSACGVPVARPAPSPTGGGTRREGVFRKTGAPRNRAIGIPARPQAAREHGR